MQFITNGRYEVKFDSFSSIIIFRFEHSITQFDLGKRYINLPKETGMFIRGQPNSAVKLDELDEFDNPLKTSSMAIQNGIYIKLISTPKHFLHRDKVSPFIIHEFCFLTYATGTIANSTTDMHKKDMHVMNG